MLLLLLISSKIREADDRNTLSFIQVPGPSVLKPSLRIWEGWKKTAPVGLVPLVVVAVCFEQVYNNSNNNEDLIIWFFRQFNYLMLVFIRGGAVVALTRASKMLTRVCVPFKLCSFINVWQPLRDSIELFVVKLWFNLFFITFIYYIKRLNTNTTIIK